MAKFILPFEIECGETTCASEPGKFCNQMQTQRFGTVYYCNIFSGWSGKFMSLYEQRYESLGEKDGWIQRHPSCLAMAKEASSGKEGT